MKKKLRSVLAAVLAVTLAVSVCMAVRRRQEDLHRTEVYASAARWVVQCRLAREYPSDSTPDSSP